MTTTLQQSARKQYGSAVLANAQQTIDALAANVHDCMQLLDSDVDETDQQFVDLDAHELEADNEIFIRVFHPQEKTQLPGTDIRKDFLAAVERVETVAIPLLHRLRTHAQRHTQRLYDYMLDEYDTFRTSMKTEAPQEPQQQQNRTYSLPTQEHTFTQFQPAVVAPTVIEERTSAHDTDTENTIEHSAVWGHAVTLVAKQIVGKD